MQNKSPAEKSMSTSNKMQGTKIHILPAPELEDNGNHGEKVSRVPKERPP